MKNLLSLAVALGIGIGVGRISNQLPTFNSTIIPTGTDKYEIQWQGKKDAPLYGSYVITSTTGSSPTRVEKINASLPHRVTFTAQKNTLITAAGATLNQGNVEIKIFKNGKDCTKVAVVGTGAMGSKICQ